MRGSARSRYRQWMTHKLATWIDQFGSSGCVGCGRCITWCPVGIDITEEVRAIREQRGGAAMQTLDELIAAAPLFARPRAATSCELIAGCGATSTSQPGELLFSEGEAADRFYLLRTRQRRDRAPRARRRRRC